MKILIHRASLFLNKIVPALRELGHEVNDSITEMNVFDTFSEFEPELLIGHTNVFNRAMAKCLKAREIKTALQFGYINDHVQAALDKIGLFFSAEKDKNYELDIPYIELPLAFDKTVYGQGEYDEYLASDIAVINEPPHPEIDKLCYPLGERNIKIFGPHKHNLIQYLGQIPPKLEQNAYYSANVCLNLSKDNENLYTCLGVGGNICSPYHEYFNSIIGDGMVHDFENIESWSKYVDKAESQVEYVLEKHTYSQRALKLLETI